MAKSLVALFLLLLVSFSLCVFAKELDTTTTLPHSPLPSSYAPPPHHHHNHHHLHPLSPTPSPIYPPTHSPLHPPSPPPHHHHHHHHPPAPAPVPAKPPTHHYPPTHAPAKAPTPHHYPPSASPSKPPTHPFHRSFVAVQGVVYTKSCKYAGVDTLLGATPLLGAIVKLECNNTRFRPLVQTVKTDKNGYFYIEAPKTITTYAFHKCKVFLVSAPTNLKPSNFHGGIEGSLLKPQKPFVSNKLPFLLFNVEPLAFEPKCY
ncbi:unnamed protein product [Lupinus luteus]|uniref:Uncharacterized protein n=1 Tax=Lupinus luteus TaxID=3873 RepID=A0AAV1WJ46_LUPLU